MRQLGSLIVRREIEIAAHQLGIEASAIEQQRQDNIETGFH
jgi:hypothetical protein